MPNKQTLWVKPPQSTMRRVLSDLVRMESLTDATIVGSSLFLFTFAIIAALMK